MSKKVILLDLDSTLINIDHRRKYIENVPKKNWSKFHAPEEIKKDIPNEWCLWLVKELSKDCDVVIVTGRSDKYDIETYSFLHKNDVPWNSLHMRKDKDNRPDFEFKREILNEKIIPTYGKENIMFALEDRKQVVDMYREEGIVCLQCKEGNY